MKKPIINPQIIKRLKKFFAIVQDSDTATRNIDAGKYVIWKNIPCHASTAIVSGDTLAIGTNLTADNDGFVNALNDSFATSGVLDTLTYGDITTTSQTLALLSGKKISDYKTIVFASYDNRMLLCTTMIDRQIFASGYTISSNAYALNNYHAVTVATYSSDTQVQMYAREIAGWSSVRCVVYGIK